jgi:hypothetical protein
MANRTRPWLVPIQWQPGQTGNPHGRGVSFISLAAHVRHITQNGRELVDLLLAIVRGESIPLPGRNGNRPPKPQRPNLSQRMQAAELLLDRGWGRAPQVIEFLGDASPEQQQQTRPNTSRTTNAPNSVHCSSARSRGRWRRRRPMRRLSPSPIRPRPRVTRSGTHETGSEMMPSAAVVAPSAILPDPPSYRR